MFFAAISLNVADGSSMCIFFFLFFPGWGFFSFTFSACPLFLTLLADQPPFLGSTSGFLVTFPIADQIPKDKRVSDRYPRSMQPPFPG